MIRAPGRRAALAALAGLVALASSPLARAQDPRAAAAQDAARKWLAIVDQFDIGASFNAASGRFREALQPDGWSNAMQSVRIPLGAVTKRTAARTEFSTRLPGFPPGDYALIMFRTAFANRDAVELVTLQVEGYRWQVIGYTIQR